jgi:uncharacterized phiE125 gp8 family phage protein
MPYGLSVVTPPVEEPVTLAEAKLWAKIDLPDDDPLVTGLIAAGRDYAERFCNRALVTQTLLLTLDSFGPDPLETERFFAFAPPLSMVLRLPRAPVQSVTSVQYIDTAGNLQTMPSSQYLLDVVTEPARICPAWGQVWPVTQPYRPAAVQIKFVAGYGAATTVPDGIKRAIKTWLADAYYNRETPRTLETVDALLWPYRVPESP